MNEQFQGGQSQGEKDVKYREGRFARALEEQTARIPSDIFLWAAGASIVGSLIST